MRKILYRYISVYGTIMTIPLRVRAFGFDSFVDIYVFTLYLNCKFFHFHISFTLQISVSLKSYLEIYFIETVIT
jgi:hypothetical protein